MEPKAVTIVKFNGDPDELLSFKKEKIDPYIRPRAQERGAVAQTVLKTDEGLMVINFFSTVEGRDAMAEHVNNDPEFHRIFEDGGKQRPVPVPYDVVQHHEMPAD